MDWTQDDAGSVSCGVTRKISLNEVVNLMQAAGALETPAPGVASEVSGAA